MSAAPSADEYATWRDNPITAWVMKGVQHYADLQPAQWLAMSWNTGEADVEALARMRTRAESYADLANLSYDDACGLHEEQS